MVQKKKRLEWRLILQGLAETVSVTQQTYRVQKII
jgi:hypothetical protein